MINLQNRLQNKNPTDKPNGTDKPWWTALRIVVNLLQSVAKTNKFRIDTKNWKWISQIVKYLRGPNVKM